MRWYVTPGFSRAAKRLPWTAIVGNGAAFLSAWTAFLQLGTAARCISARGPNLATCLPISAVMVAIRTGYAFHVEQNIFCRSSHGLKRSYTRDNKDY